MSMTYSYRKSFTAITCTVILAFAMVVTGANISASLSASNSINACVNKKTGVIRQLTAGKCSTKERLLTWNKSGVQGPRGLPGAQGAPGEHGVQGEQGAAGTNGSSLGLYAGDVEYGNSNISDCSDFNACTSLLMQVGNLSNLGDASATHLVLTKPTWLQATATVALHTLGDSTLDQSVVGCNVKWGIVGTNPRTWSAFAYSSTTISEINASDMAISTLAITGAASFPAGDYDFLIDCTQLPLLSNSQVISDRQVLNINSMDVS